MRYRLGAVVTAVGLLVATVGIQAATASGPTLTRLRVEITGTSDWQEVSFSDVFLGAHHVEAVTPGGAVERGKRDLLLRGPGGQPVSATISVLLEVYANSSFPITLRKGKLGEAQTTLYRTNDAGQVHIATIHNKNTSGIGPKEQSTSISRSKFVGPGYQMPKVDPRRLVLAFYYPWWNANTFEKGPWYDKPAGPYNTKDPAEVGAMVAQARDAGINGFVVSWDDVGDHTERFDLVLAKAAAAGMYAVPVIEMLMFKSGDSFNVPAIISTMKKALERRTKPGYLYVGAKPVLFVYGAYKMEIETWRSIANALAAAGHNPFLVGEPVSSSYGFHGSYLYNPNGQGYTGLSSLYRNNTRSLRYKAQVDPLTPQRLWAATVSPGQNMSYSKPLFPDHVDRKDGQHYTMTWSASTCSDPDWILITSWNEWFEATHIAPSERFGSLALNQTRSWSESYRNGSSCSGSGSGSGGSVLPSVPLPLKWPPGQ